MNCYLCDKLFAPEVYSQKFCGSLCRAEYYEGFKYKLPKGNKRPAVTRTDAGRTKYIRRFGKPPAGWDVHHIDYNYLNNDFENLIAVPKWLHRKIHAQGLRTRLEIETLLGEL